MAKKLGLVVLGLIVVFIGVVASRPSTFEISRSLEVKASPEIAYAQVADFHRWGAWSPWEKLDPSMKKTYSGAESGVGAKYEWVGNKDVGSGAMTIADAKPNSQLGITLEFLTPFKATNRTEFSFAPTNGGTNVTWLMKGENGFMSKAMGLMMDMDKMIGSDFEKGLAGLKTAAEADAAKAAADKAAADAAAAAAAAAAPPAPATP